MADQNPIQEADLSEARKKRVEPIVLSILQQLVDEKILLTDVTYIEQLVRDHFEHIFKQVMLVHLKETFDLVLASLSHHVNRAKAVQWGKDEGEVTVADVNDVLTSAAGELNKAQEQEQKAE